MDGVPREGCVAEDEVTVDDEVAAEEDEYVVDEAVLEQGVRLLGDAVGQLSGEDVDRNVHGERKHRHVLRGAAHLLKDVGTHEDIHGLGHRIDNMHLVGESVAA